MNKEQVNWSKYRKVPILEVKLCDDDIDSAFDPSIASLFDSRLKKPRDASVSQNFDRTLLGIAPDSKSTTDGNAVNLEGKQFLFLNIVPDAKKKPTVFLADSSLVISQLLAYIRTRASGSRESLAHVLARYPSDTRVDVFKQKSS